jgi:hypothetical protein
MDVPSSGGSSRDADDNAQADEEHHRRRDHAVWVPVGQIEEPSQIQGTDPG